MRAIVPKSMTGLVAAGIFMAALPLVAALLFAQYALDRLTQQTEALLDHGLNAVQVGARLRTQVADIERGARQYGVLDDDSLRTLTDRRWADIAQNLQTLREQSRDPGTGGAIARLQQGVDEAQSRWRDSVSTRVPLGDALREIHALLPKVDDLIAASQVQIERQMLDLRTETRRVRAEIAMSALTLIPLGALLAWGFSVVVTRPVKQMFRAIAALGHGRYEPVVVVEFPHEMRRLARQIDWLRRRLQQLEQNKDRFLQQVSHELKTPLASLREGTELLREGALGDVTQRQLEVITILSESSEELEGLIDNLLAYAEWRAEQQQAQKDWFDARDLVEDVVGLHKLLLAKNGLSVELDVRESRLFGLRSQMRVALDNLLTNAIKHSPGGSAIRIAVERVGSMFELSVRDFGRGVKEADREAIFEPFVRGEEHEEAGIRGTGIGLSIVRETVFAHGGTVTVDDAVPGARFCMAWPGPDGRIDV